MYVLLDMILFPDKVVVRSLGVLPCNRSRTEKSNTKIFLVCRINLLLKFYKNII